MGIVYKPRRITSLLNQKHDIEQKIRVLCDLKLASSEHARKEILLKNYRDRLEYLDLEILKEFENESKAF